MNDRVGLIIIINELSKEIDRLREQVKVLREALKEAVEHLEWVGYGDSYERECAGESGLIDRLESALEQAKPKGEMEAKL